ncbi:topoisomerase DNA-binding C4 zinc finger domain-containing protein [uncultured Paraglaciecola sp.]
MVKPKNTTTCPKCASPMVKRVAKKGANLGNEFLGCSSFPKCRHIEQL